MTISSTSNKAQFSGSGTTGPFPFSFKVFDSGDLTVVKTVSGTDTTLTITTHYTVSLNADQNTNPGGSVTLLSALAVGQTLTVLREVDASQETDITNGGGFYPEVIENALDKLTMLSQQNAEQISRAVIAGVTEDPQAFLQSIFDAETNAVAAAASAGSSATAADASADAAAASAATFVTQANGSTQITTGTTAQRDASPLSGYFRFNTTLGQFEGYNGSAWGSVGGAGATGGGTDKVFVETDQTITTDYTLTANKNAMTAGPVTIADGKTVTIPSGATWVIV